MRTQFGTTEKSAMKTKESGSQGQGGGTNREYEGLTLLMRDGWQTWSTYQDRFGSI